MKKLRNVSVGLMTSVLLLTTTGCGCLPGIPCLPNIPWKALLAPFRCLIPCG